MNLGIVSCHIPARDYDLAATLDCGQAFRWTLRDGAWEGVVGSRWVRLRAAPEGIQAETMGPADDWAWLKFHLQSDVDLGSVILSFPDDAVMRASVIACRGLRLLRQDPWECLASFILSSTKQIVQIRQIIGLLCLRFGERIPAPPGSGPLYDFPTAERLAASTEAELRDCQMGFRAPNLLAAARFVAGGGLDLQRLHTLPVAEARGKLIELRGVGEKIANCVLLFGCGFQQAFPVDVWVRKAIRELYFPKRRPAPRRLAKFVDTYFGTHSGYAQQYLFHYMRTRGKSRVSDR
ncbi:MAG: N-glycosylase/DNA lyase [Verrucomicrobiota bacterium]|jgi:N-glycosylase/DNA lyase